MNEQYFETHFKFSDLKLNSSEIGLSYNKIKMHDSNFNELMWSSICGVVKKTDILLCHSVRHISTLLIIMLILKGVY